MNNLVNTIGEYISIIQVLIGGILTFLGGIVGNQLLHIRQRKNDRENLSATFAGEISAILWIINRRNYIREIEVALDGMRHGKRVRFTGLIVRDYLLVYKQNVGKLGVLDSPLSNEIVTFYTYVNALLEDNGELAAANVDTIDLNYLIRRHEDALELLNKTVKCGDKILKEFESSFHFENEIIPTQVEQNKDNPQSLT